VGSRLVLSVIHEIGPLWGRFADGIKPLDEIVERRAAF
jgi:hypothetical protein